jgi:hypothetical protein
MENDPFAHLKEKQRLDGVLLSNLKQHAVALRETLDRANEYRAYEDGMYRFYYGSWKVFRLQSKTAEMITALVAISPDRRAFSQMFQEIIRAGTDKRFTEETNGKWMEETLPIVTASLHTRYFLEMCVEYASLETPPQPMPSGWAALTCLYDFR